jgi:hypothetical protein
VNFLLVQREPKHVTIGLFEVVDTNGAVMAPKILQLLNKFSFIQKNVVYIKVEGFNMQSCVAFIDSIILTTTKTYFSNGLFQLINHS